MGPVFISSGLPGPCAAGVKGDESSAVAHECRERLFGLGRPAGALVGVAAVEVADHHVITGEVRFRWERQDADRESASAIRDEADRTRPGLPVVVVEAIDHQDADGGAADPSMAVNRNKRTVFIDDLQCIQWRFPWLVWVPRLASIASSAKLKFVAAWRMEVQSCPYSMST